MRAPKNDLLAHIRLVAPAFAGQNNGPRPIGTCETFARQGMAQGANYLVCGALFRGLRVSLVLRRSRGNSLGPRPQR